MIEFVSDMRLTREEILRATPACQVLAWSGRVLRTRYDTDLYHRSKPCREIQQFLTHSWHGNAWNKIFLLMILKNGLPALVAGTLAAFAILPVVFFGYLPPLGPLEGQRAASGWCITAGSLVAFLVLLLWRSQSQVFLDKICINQQDPRLKVEGLASMGGFLKRSRQMLVCWDETYCSRLWCVFELGAFLQCQEASQLQVRPVYLGPCSLLLFAATAASVFAWRSWRPSGDFGRYVLLVALIGATAVTIFFALCTWAFRRYFRRLDEMRSQLLNFAVENVLCYCCERGHVRTDEQQLKKDTICDREIIRECTIRWFGSVENFEHSVQSTVLAELSKQLGKYSFPYLWIVGCTIPMLWSILDELVVAILDQDAFGFASSSLFLLGWWFGSFPILFLILLAFSHRFRKQYRSCVGMFLNLACIWVALPLYLVMNIGETYLRMLLQNDVAARAIFAALSLLGAGLLYRCWSKMEK